MICIALLVIQNLYVIFLWNINILHHGLILLALQIWTLVWSPSELSSSHLNDTNVKQERPLLTSSITLLEPMASHARRKSSIVML